MAWRRLAPRALANVSEGITDITAPLSESVRNVLMADGLPMGTTRQLTVLTGLSLLAAAYSRQDLEIFDTSAGIEAVTFGCPRPTRELPLPPEAGP